MKRRKAARWIAALTGTVILAGVILMVVFFQFFVVGTQKCFRNGLPCFYATGRYESLVYYGNEGAFLIKGHRVYGVNADESLKIGRLILLPKNADSFRMDGTVSHGDQFDARLTKKHGWTEFDFPIVTSAYIIRGKVRIFD